MSEDSPDYAGAVAIVEHATSHGALATGQVQEGRAARVLVRVTSVRKRLLDADNLCEKYHVDCCRYAGLVPGDRPDQIVIETTQRKALKGEAEHTIVEVERIDRC